MAGARDEASSDEAELRWKRNIRDQVEEDLERQVRLRLRYDSLMKQCRQPSLSSHLYALQLQRQKMTEPIMAGKSVMVGNSVGKPNMVLKPSMVAEPNLPDSTMVATHTELVHHIPADDVLQPGVRGAEDTVLQPGVRGAEDTVLQPGLRGAAGSERNVVTCGPANSLTGTENSNQGEFSLPQVLEYVSVKYGVPRIQLNKLNTDGHYATVAINTSDDGSGPIIKCPLESRVILPTPCHKKTVSQANAEVGHDVPPDVMNSSMVNEGGHVAFVNGLEFESRFESGNLLKVVQISAREYCIWLAPDLYSKRYTQWFYFMVRGMVAKVSYTFHIVNLYKPDSLYSCGMQPLLYSERRAKVGDGDWCRAGHNISYHQTKTQHISRDGRGQHLYTLSWTMEFPCSEDTCYLAHCFPYPYSQMLSHLSTLQEDYSRSCYIRRDILCYTIAGNACPLLTITNFEDSAESRQGVVVTARVHPGETNSSWMMEGLIDFLTSDCDHAKTLRDQYVFKLVPMLNPDGVIVGNYRTSLSGVDLNRVYKSPLPDIFPTVFHTKKMMENFIRERKLLLYVDLHGHSRKQNVFMYGCHAPQCSHLQLLDEHVIPYLFSQQAPQMFDYNSCKFNVHKCKEATGRVVTWRMGVPNSFTMESTFFGSTFTDKKRHFSSEDLLNMGASLGEVFHCYHQYNKNERYKRMVQCKLAELMMKSVLSSGGKILPSGGKILPSGGHTLPPIALKQPEVLHKKKDRATKVLNRFMMIDISVLEEQESSTSGSDSEDDVFAWKKVKRKQKQKSKSRLQLPQIVNRPELLATNLQDLPSKATSIGCGRVKETKSRSHPTWKFTNKYQNRHSGGIPIFSEERLQERKAKQQKRRSMWCPVSNNENIATSLAGNKDMQLETNRRENNIGRFKLPPHLAQYIHETWKS